MTTTTRFLNNQVSKDEDANPYTARLELEESIHKKARRSALPDIGLNMDDSKEITMNTSMNNTSGMKNNTIDKIRDFKIEDNSVDLDALEKSNLKTPKQAGQEGSFQIQFKSNATTNKKSFRFKEGSGHQPIRDQI